MTFQKKALVSGFNGQDGPRSPEMMHRVGDASKSACGLGWKPKMSLNDLGKRMPDADLLADEFQVPVEGDAICKKSFRKMVKKRLMAYGDML
jgi:hypothetical protein